MRPRTGNEEDDPHGYSRDRWRAAVAIGTLEHRLD
jgi:hypothetical protein